MKRSHYITLFIIITLITAVFAYWYFFFNGPGATVTTPIDNADTESGFNPFNRTTSSTGNTTSNSTSTRRTTNVITNSTGNLPVLRLLSNTPVGGYGASTTPNIASTTKTKAMKGKTIVRWIDRGRGNVYEANSDTNEILTISNTVLPRMYESVWNRNISAFIGTVFADGANSPTVLYAQLKNPDTNKKFSTSTDTSITPTGTNRAIYELKGKNLPDKMLAYDVSPKGDKIFMLVNESGKGVGYIANFDGSSVVRIFSTPLLQLNVEWPEENTIAITTKGSASQAGFMYFVNTKTGTWKKILGPINGLSTKTSHNAKYVIYSSATMDKQGVNTNIYNVAKAIASEASVKTLADKCAWGNNEKEMIYCAAPSEPISAIYPDDWYKGNISFTDKIWQINAVSNEIRLISSIVDQSDRVIDVSNLKLDARDEFLFFMNKKDLSLWSLDLI